MSILNRFVVGNHVGVVAVAMLAFSACRTNVEGLDAGRQAGSRMSSVTMPIPEKLKPFLGSDKVNAWSLSVIGGECTNGGSSVSHKEKFGMFSDNNVLINEKITSGCSYTFILSLGKANADNSKLEKIYLTNDFDGKRTEVTKENTKVAKIPVGITLYFTEDGQKALGGSPDGSIQTNEQPAPSPVPTPEPTPTPNPETSASGDANCHKGDARICKVELLIAEKTNAYRRAQGLAPLDYDAKVGFVSRDWSAKQANSGNIGHGGFPSSRTAVYREEFGSSIYLSAENVAYNFCDPSRSEDAAATAFVQQWWNSSGHRRNMLGSHAAIGVGISIDRYGRCYGTQLFR